MGLRKLKWLKFLYIGYNEAQAEQTYWDTKLENHNKDDHGEGVVKGLGVTATTPATLTIVVPAGRALDEDGNDLVVTAQTQLDLTSHIPGVGQGTIVVYIIAKFSEQDIDNYYVPETGTYQFKYSEDTISIQATQNPSGVYIELARVALTVGASAVSDPVDPVSPGTDEIDQRFTKEIIIPGLVVLKPEEESNLNVALVSMAKGDKYLMLPGEWTFSSDFDFDQDDVTIIAPEPVLIQGAAGAKFSVTGKRVRLVNVHILQETSTSPYLDVSKVYGASLLSEMYNNQVSVNLVAGLDNAKQLSLDSIHGCVTLFDKQLIGASVRTRPSKSVRVVSRDPNTIFTTADWTGWVESGTSPTQGTWYAVYLIGSSDDPITYEPRLLVSRSFAGIYDYDAAEATPDEPTLPTGYDVFRLIGSIRTQDASTDLIAMMKEGETCHYIGDQQLAYNQSSNVWHAVDASSRIPPYCKSGQITIVGIGQGLGATYFYITIDSTQTIWRILGVCLEGDDFGETDSLQCTAQQSMLVGNISFWYRLNGAGVTETVSLIDYRERL